VDRRALGVDGDQVAVGVDRLDEAFRAQDRHALVVAQDDIEIPELVAAAAGIRRAAAASRAARDARPGGAVGILVAAADSGRPAALAFRTAAAAGLVGTAVRVAAALARPVGRVLAVIFLGKDAVHAAATLAAGTAGTAALSAIGSAAHEA